MQDQEVLRAGVARIGRPLVESVVVCRRLSAWAMLVGV